MALFGQSSFVGGGSTSFGTTAGSHIHGRPQENIISLLENIFSPIQIKTFV